MFIVKLLRQGQLSGWSPYTWTAGIHNGKLAIFMECGGFTVPYQSIGPEDDLAILSEKGDLLETHKTLLETLERNSQDVKKSASESPASVPSTGIKGSVGPTSH